MYTSTAWLYNSSITARFSRGDGKKRTLMPQWALLPMRSALAAGDAHWQRHWYTGGLPRSVR